MASLGIAFKIELAMGSTGRHCMADVTSQSAGTLAATLTWWTTLLPIETPIHLHFFHTSVLHSPYGHLKVVGSTYNFAGHPPPPFTPKASSHPLILHPIPCTLPMKLNASLRNSIFIFWLGAASFQDSVLNSTTSDNLLLKYFISHFQHCFFPRFSGI